MNSQLFVYSEGKKAFLKFTENISKTCVNVCLSKSNLLGKDFTFSLSLPFSYGFWSGLGHPPSFLRRQPLTDSPDGPHAAAQHFHLSVFPHAWL